MTPVERVARAIWEDDRKAIQEHIASGKVSASMSGIDRFWGGWEAEADVVKSTYRRRARAALAAMREPSEGMVIVGHLSIEEWAKEWSVIAASCAYRAMIDKALEEG